MRIRTNSINRFWLTAAGLLIFWAGAGKTLAAKLDSSAWRIYSLNTTNVLANLTDNNPATFDTLSNSMGMLIDMGQTNVVDRLFLVGATTTNLSIWPNYISETNPPLGLIVVSVGNNTNSMTNQVAIWTVPPDAGNPVNTEVDLRFSPATGRYVRVQLQTNVTWGVNYWPGYALASPPPPPVNLMWNVGEVELYGFNGQFTNLNAVVCDSFTNSLARTCSISQPLQIAALDLSYYLGELTGIPHPIITSSQTNLYPGRIYRVMDLASFAPNYYTMMTNIASGELPTNPVVSVVGREIQFSGWPYRCVDWGVWQFLEDQGVRWVYPDGHGDFVPTGEGVSTNMLPMIVVPSAISIYANFDCNQFHPWGEGDLQSVRQGYLYPWRNRWNGSWNAGPIGGAEIPAMPSPGGTVNSNYIEGFTGYPGNFASVVPNRILETLSSPYTNYWGWASTNAGSQVNPTNNPDGNAPVFTMDNPALISWVANKMTNIAAVKPLACSYPLNIAHFDRGYNLLPMDSSVYSQDPFTLASNGPVQLNSVPWVDLYGGVSMSGQYYSFVNAVATQAQQEGYTGLVGALAYADVFAPPTNITSFPSNVQVEVCLYGAPNLPMSAPANAALKAAFDGWHARCSHLATYDYALLHTDVWEPDPRLPVPLVAGTVSRAQYLASIGALDGGCQANLTSLPFNPWNFYAYPRIRWNTNQTAAQLETEFFNGYFREASAPMLAYYQSMENYQVTNNISMYYMGYCYGITPNSFPLSVLASMKANLTVAEQLATNWYVINRVADMQNEFNWLITNTGLAGVTLTNPPAFQVIGSTTIPYTVNLTNMAKFGYTVWGNFADLISGPPAYWWFGAQGQIQEAFNVATPGTYTVSITARGVEATNIWPMMNVYFGMGNESVCVNTATNSTYNFTFTAPAGTWDLVINYNNAANGGARNLFISNIQITQNSTTAVVIPPPGPALPAVQTVQTISNSGLELPAVQTAQVIPNPGPALPAVQSVQIIPNTRPAFQSVLQTAGNIAMTWNALVGTNYQFQITTNPIGGNWQNYGPPVTATNSIMSWSDVIGSNRQRYYRMLVE